jgi:hypothetical protein
VSGILAFRVRRSVRRKRSYEVGSNLRRLLFGYGIARILFTTSKTYSNVRLFHLLMAQGRSVFVAVSDALSRSLKAVRRIRALLYAYFHPSQLFTFRFRASPALLLTAFQIRLRGFPLRFQKQVFGKQNREAA